MSSQRGASGGSNPVKKVPIHLQSSQNRLILKSGKIVNADGMTDGDVFIEDGCIKEIGKNLIIPGGTRSIDARGKYIMPGGIDVSTHFQMPCIGIKSADDFYTGTKAAVAGGTTMIFDTVVPEKGESLLDAYGKWRTWAENQVCCDYTVRVALTSWSEKVKGEMEVLVRDHGVNSFKIYMSNKDESMLRDNEIYAALETCKKLGALALIHAENGDIIAENSKKIIAAGITGPEGHELSRPEEVETEATHRACVLGSQVNCPVYVVPVMSKSAGDIIAEKRQQGCVVFGEAIAASVGTDGTNYRNPSWRHAAAHVVNPPLRPDPETPAHLLNLLARDDLQVVGSENCTFTHEQKKLGATDFRKIPSGVNGVEDRMSVVWQKGVQEGRMDPTRFVAVTSTNAAKIFNVFPQKGAVLAGSDADLVIWDPRKTRTISAKTHHHATDNNIFEGMTCFGVPEYVICNGRVCVDEGQVKVLQGFGNFVQTPPFAPFVYDLIRDSDQRKLAKLKPVLRDGTDGEMMSKVQNGVEHVHVSESPKPVTNSGGGGFYDNARKESVQSLPPPTPVEEIMVKSPSGVRNMQESTLDKEPKIEEIEKIEVPAPAVKLIEEQAEPQRATIRVKAPPGGFSSGLW
ncbi:dihydropyrimidinase isoform X1 [Folsomia candida]|uniref:dihydropyrimidinase isoform X1 n=1 Tax=Folsomia candida TaxID=158441 RepID=UPI000B907B62|nr:dihydropyrimidinase isoform X1 [Folsomia candida]XP_021954369.1 dihydropyrimidinase isoform X1 [Folsomia candida]XP_035709167.1 dihydropyrimidinase isoform X1 [Folsomia candida]